ncbi:MAG: hypothetical protein FWE07_05790 [Turicibacter sp.]|nr:hypothetical protein [Turicibacter sp.]
MKGYYKNWYQHYLEVEKEKEQELQRGYYSNLAKKEEKPLPKNEKAERVQPEKEASLVSTAVPTRSGRNKKRFRVLGLFLPISTVVGFGFLWYQMDIGPIREWTNEALVFVGLREEALCVVSRHTHLLEQHMAFADHVSAYLADDEDVDLETLQLMYEEIRSAHLEVGGLSGEAFEEVNRLWTFMLYSTTQMMHELTTDGEVADVYEVFASDQTDIGAMIMTELGLY